MQATDLGHGRGWLDKPAADSIHRIDQQLGRPADINDAGRSAAQADKNYAAWIAYRNGTGPKAPYALPASKSVHCIGLATDSDDWYTPATAAIWRANGWRQTARYPNNPAKDEIWHAEYFINLDTHRNDPTEDDMGTIDDTDHNQIVIGKAIQRALRFDVRPDGYGADWHLGPTIWERLNVIEAAAKTGVTIDPTGLAKAVADAIPDNLAADVATELSKRLAS